MPSRHPPSAHRAPSARPLPLPPNGTNETKWNTFSNSPPLPHSSSLLHVTNVTGCYTFAFLPPTSPLRPSHLHIHPRRKLSMAEPRPRVPAPSAPENTVIPNSGRHRRLPPRLMGHPENPVKWAKFGESGISLKQKVVER